jgi:hypothetical protein
MEINMKATIEKNKIIVKDWFKQDLFGFRSKIKRYFQIRIVYNTLSFEISKDSIDIYIRYILSQKKIPYYKKDKGWTFRYYIFLSQISDEQILNLLAALENAADYIGLI